MTAKTFIVSLASLGLFACASSNNKHGTLAELESVAADIDEVFVADSLARAAESYRRYLDETAENRRTPEAMRRLADLQIEQAYGVIGSGEIVEMAVPDAATPTGQITAERRAGNVVETGESEREFEARATAGEQLYRQATLFDAQMPGGEAAPVPAGPREAIKTYWTILETYPNYERNDQVLYQLSRAYDEIGEPDKAMEVMDRLITEYPYSKYLDEVYFRRGEYYFVRKRYVNAEDAFGAVIKMGSTSSYYELALYKLGWSMYKQELYEEGLHNFIAVLDYRHSIGFDFDSIDADSDEHRLEDTFRVISLSFSNLGGPSVVDEYFARYGHRSYAHKVYGNLGEFYFSKLRYEDAASVYRSYIALNPFHKVSPHFGMRVIEIYGEAGFPLLVVKAKKEFATTYALNAEYWSYFETASAPEVIDFLKANLTDLAGHYHALYQEPEFVDERAANFTEAQHWYRQYLASFPGGDETPRINYQLADLLLENENFGDAAAEYERTAYEYGQHEKDSAAGYAAIYAHREHLKVATGARQRDVKGLTVASSLRFADTFPAHEHAPTVLGHAADDLYEMKDLPLAIAAARKLIERYPATDKELVRSAWAVVANSSIDLTEYVDAEDAYANVLSLTGADDEKRAAVVDGLAAAIYKQGEQANLLQDYRAAADHFLRIKERAPTSGIRTAAEYDAAVALMKLEDWMLASNVLEEFRVSHPDEELSAEATKQLAHIYREDGQTAKSAAEHERIAAEADDAELARDALLLAGDLYDEAGVVSDAIRVYEQYVSEYPHPSIPRWKRARGSPRFSRNSSTMSATTRNSAPLSLADRQAGAGRTDRSRYPGVARRAGARGIELQAVRGAATHSSRSSKVWLKSNGAWMWPWRNSKNSLPTKSPTSRQPRHFISPRSTSTSAPRCSTRNARTA